MHRDPAIVRRFDAPEALDIRFYEILARSAINRVPKASRLPFRSTIDHVSRVHSCVYVLRIGRDPDSHGGRSPQAGAQAARP